MNFALGWGSILVLLAHVADLIEKLADVHTTSQPHGKLDPTSRKWIFIRYPEEPKGCMNEKLEVSLKLSPTISNLLVIKWFS